MAKKTKIEKVVPFIGTEKEEPRAGVLTTYKKRNKPRSRTSISRNKSVQGDTIEVMIERLMQGEGESAIEDRDLVYNDNEVDRVNPITNIRTDKMETMLEEKIGMYDWRHRKTQTTVEDEPNEDQEVIEN